MFWSVFSYWSLPACFSQKIMLISGKRLKGCSIAVRLPIISIVYTSPLCLPLQLDKVYQPTKTALPARVSLKRASKTSPLGMMLSL